MLTNRFQLANLCTEHLNLPNLFSVVLKFNFMVILVHDMTSKSVQTLLAIQKVEVYIELPLEYFPSTAQIE